MFNCVRFKTNFGFSKRGSFTENNGTIINAQLRMVKEIFNFFKNFTFFSQFFSPQGDREKWRLKKIKSPKQIPRSVILFTLQI